MAAGGGADRIIRIAAKEHKDSYFSVGCSSLWPGCEKKAADQIRAIARLRSQRHIFWAFYPGRRSRTRLPWATYISPRWGFSLRLRRQLDLSADGWTGWRASEAERSRRELERTHVRCYGDGLDARFGNCQEFL